MYKVVLGSMLALAALTANAKIDSSSDGAATKVNLSGSFEEQRVAILKDLDGGKVYAEITPTGHVSDHKANSSRLQILNKLLKNLRTLTPRRVSKLKRKPQFIGPLF